MDSAQPFFQRHKYTLKQNLSSSSHRSKKSPTRRTALTRSPQSPSPTASIVQAHHEVLDRVPRTKQVLGLEGGGGVAVDPEGGAGDATVNPLVGGGGEGVEEDGPTPPIASGLKVVVRYLLLLLLLLLLSMSDCRYSTCLVFSQFRDEEEKREEVYNMSIMLFCKKKYTYRRSLQRRTTKWRWLS